MPVSDARSGGHWERETRGTAVCERSTKMTAHKAFKPLVRAWMEKTGESYTAALPSSRGAPTRAPSR
jgi:hypothetical protein